MDRLTAWHASQTPALPGYVPAPVAPTVPAPAPGWTADAATWSAQAYPAYPGYPTYPTYPAYPAPAGYLDASIGQLMQQLSAIQAYILSLLAPVAPPAPGPTPIPTPVPTPGPTPAPAGRTSFVISSFNVLGSSHTTAGGNKPQYRSGPARIHDAVKILEQEKVEVVGFQEFQTNQAKEFLKIAGEDYGLYPGPKLGGGPVQNSVAWRKDTFDLVKPATFEIPYFHGHKMKMPVVLLRHKRTGQEIYVLNIHNPASTKRVGDQERFRDAATQIEIDLVNRLRATGKPVFLTGDFNEREEAFQKVTRGAAMTSADAPSGKPAKRMGIDWIFGTQGVRFSGYERRDDALVDRTTDHPVVTARATIGG